MNIRSSPSYRFTVALKWESLKLSKFDESKKSRQWAETGNE